MKSSFSHNYCSLLRVARLGGFDRFWFSLVFILMLLPCEDDLKQEQTSCGCLWKEWHKCARWVCIVLYWHCISADNRKVRGTGSLLEPASSGPFWKCSFWLLTHTLKESVLVSGLFLWLPWVSPVFQVSLFIINLFIFATHRDYMWTSLQTYTYMRSFVKQSN